MDRFDGISASFISRLSCLPLTILAWGDLNELLMTDSKSLLFSAEGRLFYEVSAKANAIGLLREFYDYGSFVMIAGMMAASVEHCSLIKSLPVFPVRDDCT